MKSLGYSEQGNVTFRLNRNVNKYGPMTTKGFKKGREYMLCSHDISDSDDNSRNVAEQRIGAEAVDQVKVRISCIDMESVVLELRTKDKINVVPRFINELLSSHDRKVDLELTLYTPFRLRNKATIQKSTGRMNQELYLCQDIEELQNAENAMTELRDEQKETTYLVPNGALSSILDEWNNFSAFDYEPYSKLKDSNRQKPSTSKINVELFNDQIRNEPTMMNALRVGCMVLFNIPYTQL